MKRNEQLALLWLTERAGLSVQNKVLDKAFLPSFFEMDKNDWLKCGLNESQAKRLSDQRSIKGLESRLDKMLESGINIVHRDSGKYPFTVECASDLPPVLFVKSKHDILYRDGVGVVGSRKATTYGLDVARQIGREAALRGLPTVSGAALGIDTAAHNGSLDSGGATIAVLGCGMYHTYPKSAGPLLERIYENGMVISQFAPNVPPDRKTFPIRNAVIAALTSSVVVVEGASKSGARHTAKYAKQYGRKLFAVPGEISRPQATLPNQLIREGAKILLNPADPVDALAEKSGKNTTKQRSNKQVAMTFDKNGASDIKSNAGILDKLEPVQRKLLNHIQNSSGSIDDILTADIADSGQINQILLELELQGLVKQEGGRHYVCLLHN